MNTTAKHYGLALLAFAGIVILVIAVVEEQYILAVIGAGAASTGAYRAWVTRSSERGSG